KASRSAGAAGGESRAGHQPQDRQGARSDVSHHAARPRRRGDRMRRREFISGLGAAGWPLLVRAQQRTKPTIGWLDIQPGGPQPEFVEGFRRGLAEAGFSEGRNVTVEYQTADGHFERLQALAADLVSRRPAAIIARSDPAALAAKAA